MSLVLEDGVGRSVLRRLRKSVTFAALHRMSVACSPPEKNLKAELWQALEAYSLNAQWSNPARIRDK
jgi:hypothetical protein